MRGSTVDHAHLGGRRRRRRRVALVARGGGDRQHRDGKSLRDHWDSPCAASTPWSRKATSAVHSSSGWRAGAPRCRDSGSPSTTPMTMAPMTRAACGPEMRNSPCCRPASSTPSIRPRQRPPSSAERAGAFGELAALALHRERQLDAAGLPEMLPEPADQLVEQVAVACPGARPATPPPPRHEARRTDPGCTASKRSALAPK